MKEYYEIATRNVEDDFHKRVEAAYYSFEEAKSNINNYCSNDGYDHGPGTCWIYHVLEEDNGEKTELECWSYIDGECEVYGDLRTYEFAIEEAIGLLTENGWLKEHDKEISQSEYKRGYQDGYSKWHREVYSSGLNSSEYDGSLMFRHWYED